MNPKTRLIRKITALIKDGRLRRLISASKFVFCGIIGCSTGLAADFYVATNGSDAIGDGSFAKPWATIQYAVTATSHHGQADYSAQKNIWVRGGNYYNVMVNMTSWDAANFLISSYSNEVAVLYGGQPLTNWTYAGSNNWWVASLGTFPSVVASSPNGTTTWQPRMLLADNVVCTRGRLPKTGKFHYTSLSGTTLTYTNNFPNTTNMELMIDKSWSDSEMYVTAINTKSNTMTLNSSVTLGPNTADVHSFAIVNIPQAINGDNQYFWDKGNNTITYQSPGNVNPNTKTMVVATTSRMFWMQGFGADTGISNIVFSKLTFSCANAICGNGATTDDYAEANQAAMRWSNATNCIIDHCTFFGIAGNAIGNENWSQDWNLTIQNTTIHDIGGGGINMPGTTQLTVSNCLIYNTGLICQSGPGIIAFTYGGQALCNTITNCMGAGIMMIPSGSEVAPTTVTDNHIIRCVKALRDMGAIYGGGGPHIVMRNYIRDINGTNSDNGGVWDPFLIGIYSDTSSHDWVVASNVTYNCTRPFMYHNGTNGIYLNNYFVNTRNENTILMLPDSDAPTFQRNIFLTAQTPLVDAQNSSYTPFSVNVNSAVKDWHSNIVWSTTGQNGNNPTNAISADPLFYKISPMVAAFQSGSPAPLYGIQPLPVPVAPPTDVRVETQP